MSGSGKAIAGLGELGGPAPPVTMLAALNRRLEAACAYGAGLCLAVFTLTVFVDVVFRQLFAYPLLWPAEISAGLFVWSVMLGSAVCTRRQSHLTCDVLPRLGPRPELVLRILVNLLSLVFAATVAWTGIELMLAGFKRLSPMMGYPLWPFFAAIPVPALAMLLFSLELILKGSPPTRSEAGEGDGGEAP